MDPALHPGKVAIRLSEENGGHHRVIGLDHTQSCTFTGYIELEDGVGPNPRSPNPSRRGVRSSSLPSESSLRPTQIGAKTITQLHSFQLMIALSSSPDSQDDGMAVEPQTVSIMNSTGAEHIPNSPIRFGQVTKIPATFTSVCPFSIDLPPQLYPSRLNQTSDYTISARVCFRITDLSSPETPQLVATATAETAVSIRRTSPSIEAEERTMAWMTDSMRGMDIDQEVVVPRSLERRGYGYSG